MTVTPPLLFVLTLAALDLAGCHLPGKPAAGDTPQRPDQVTSFKSLYSTNCAACHGAQGKHGAAISLANPAYLAYAGEGHIEAITGKGIAGSLMPAFAKSSGGLLTDEQVHILAHSMVAEWSNPAALHGGVPPTYESKLTGDPHAGEEVYKAACLSCHAATRGGLLDPTYLALISDGGLRTIIVSGKPEEGMPDWQDLKTGVLTDQNISDVVSYLSSHRTKAPGQPYANQQGAPPASLPLARTSNPNTPVQTKGQP